MMSIISARKTNLRQVIIKPRFLFLFCLMMAFFIVNALSPHAFIRVVMLVSVFFLVLYSIYIIHYCHRSLWMMTIASGVLGLVFALCELFVESPMLFLFKHLMMIIFYSSMFVASLLSMLEDKSISVTSLFSALCAYLFIGLWFSTAYQCIYLLNTDAFHLGVHQGLSDGEDFIYYSFVTLTTLGYGDIQPLSAIAKTLSWIEAYIGQAYLTIVMALLVGAYLHQHFKDKT